MKGYFDESGKTEPPVFVMAGFLARAEAWAKFVLEWQRVLSLPPAIEAFHMKDAIFPRDLWRLRLFLEIIKKHALVGLATTVLQEDYRAVFAKVARRMDHPYLYMYHKIMSLAFQWELRSGIDEPIDFIFDEQNEQSDYLQSLHTRMVEAAPEEARKRFGNRPIHADDRCHPPLQAADILAWTLRRMAEHASKRTAPEAYLQEIISTMFPHEGKFYMHPVTRKMMQEEMQVSRKINEHSGMVFEHEATDIVLNLDAVVTALNETAIDSALPGSTVSLQSIPAKQMKRYLLVHICPHAGKPHLHKRSSNECLAATSVLHF
ncbi:MAG: DUF3800 domain-containing protein [Rhizomicrobium sp.]